MTRTKNNKIPVFGVIVSGVTKEDAIERYLDAVNGNSVSLYTSQSSNLGILSEAGTHLFNPITSSADMEESEDSVETMLSSYSSGGDSLQAHYMLCSDGCGAHVVASDNFISQFCPVCASALADPEDANENGIDDDLEDFDDSFEDESKSESYDELTDEEIDNYSAIAGISISEDEETDDDDSDLDLDDSEFEDEDEDEDDDSDLDLDDSDEDEDDSDEDEPVEKAPVETENTDAAKSDIVAVSPNKEDAIATYAEACISGAFKKYTSSLSGSSFYSASTVDAEINFDPILGDPNLESKDVIISTSSLDAQESVDAHYMVCASAECGAHIVTSNEELSFCPVCASNVEEPEIETEEDDDENDLSLNVLEDEDECKTPSAPSNEKSLSQVLSFVAGGNDVLSNKLNVAYCGNIDGENSWIAFYNGQPIAKATASSAQKHKAIFEEPAFANAVLAGAEHLGISKILDEMGFQASMSSVAISSQLEKNILNKHFKDKLKAMSAQLENEVAEKSADYRERFIAALSTAAVGINRGFFKGYVNPVKQTLLNSLSAAGVRQPEVMLDNVFRSHSDDYNKQLIEKALEIIEKPVEVQNEIAIAVSQSNYMGASTASSETNDVEGRLTTLGKEVQTQQTVVQQNTSVSSAGTTFDTARLKNVVSTLGKRYN